MSKSKLDHIYQSITDNVIETIESGSLTSIGQMWTDLYQSPALNAVTGRAYNGINILQLGSIKLKRCFELPLWAGLKQWKNAECSVKKGSRGTPVIFVKAVDVLDEDTEEVVGQRYFSQYSYVFNIDQVEGWQNNKSVCRFVDQLKAKDDGKLNPFRIKEIDSLIVSSGAKLITSSNGAYFHHGLDHIGMPPLSSFDTKNCKESAIENYYAVLLHELVHWTGHKSRLERKVSANRFSKECAFEELIAELGSAFLCAKYGVTQTPRASHASYISSWLTLLENDNRAILDAAFEAQKACEYLQNYNQQKTNLAA